MAQIFIVGLAGQVGGALAEAFAPWWSVAGTYREVPFAGAVRFDLEAAARDDAAAHALLEGRDPEVCVIAAGFTWVDGCERDPARAMAVNRDGPAAVARAAKARGARTVYYSTEYVFDGESGPYAEDDEVNPLSVYGRSKLEGEEAIREVDPEALILRTTVVYGPEIQGKNFAYQLARRMIAGESMPVPSDQISSPTYNRDLALATRGLVESGASGVFHVTGSERLDRVAFARRLGAAAGFPTVGLSPRSTAELRQQASRPLGAGLSIHKVQRALGHFEPRSVEAAVTDWIANPRGRPWPRGGC